MEPKDWMPEKYRKTLIRQISQHAHSEVVGKCFRKAIGSPPRFPEPAAQSHPAGKVQASKPAIPTCTAPARPLAYRANRPSSDLLTARPSTVTSSTTPPPTWADIGAVGWLVDGAAIVNQGDTLPTGATAHMPAPWCASAKRGFHQRQGMPRCGPFSPKALQAEGNGPGCAEPLVRWPSDDVRPTDDEQPRTGAEA